jgi:hypothetical protein
MSTFNSNTVSPNQTATAAQYNDLREDAIRNAGDFAVATGSSNAYAITVDAQIDALVAGDVFKFQANFTNTGASTLNVNGLGAISIRNSRDTALIPNDILNGQIVEVVYNGTTFQFISSATNSQIQFGGTGADGILNITSNTSIDLGGAAVFVRNYTTINVSVGVTLSFTNPATNGTLIVFNATGDVTVAGTISLVGVGAAAGAGVTLGAGSGVVNGNAGTVSYSFLKQSGAGGGGVGITSGGIAGVAPIFDFVNSPVSIYSALYSFLHIGAGGGSGALSSAGSGSGGLTGAGGRGGGAFALVCGGNLVFTGTIDIRGAAGTNATAPTGSRVCTGGGAGGGGSFVGYYRGTITNSGTITTTAAVGGNTAGTGTTASFGGGGGAAKNAGNIGTNTASPGKSGGDGAIAISYGFNLLSFNNY